MIVKYIVLAFFIAAIVMALESGHVAARQNTITIPMGPGRDGSQTGTAVLTEQGAQTLITIDIQPGTGEQPAHIHDSACPNIGTIRYPLSSVVNGKSSTTLSVDLASLQRTRMAINVHRSTDITQYTSCGNIPTIPGVTPVRQPGSPNGLPRVGEDAYSSKIIGLMIIGLVVMAIGYKLRPSRS